MLIRCTNKLIKEMGLTKADLCEGKEDKSLLGGWYANLFYVKRKKCIIFVNARTLFCAVSFDVNRAQIKNLGELFRLVVGKALLEEDINGSKIQEVVNEAQEIYFAKARDKVVLGTMVQYVKQIKWTIEYRGNWETANLSAIAKEQNRTPLPTQKFFCGEEELKRVIGEQHRSAGGDNAKNEVRTSEEFMADFKGTPLEGRIFDNGMCICDACGKKKAIGGVINPLSDKDRKVICKDCMIEETATRHGITKDEALKRRAHMRDSLNAFREIVFEKYLRENNKKEFDSLEEAKAVIDMVMKRWNSFPKEFHDMTDKVPKKDLKKIYREVEVDFKAIRK